MVIYAQNVINKPKYHFRFGIENVTSCNGSHSFSKHKNEV